MLLSSCARLLCWVYFFLYLYKNIPLRYNISSTRELRIIDLVLHNSVNNYSVDYWPDFPFDELD